MESLQGYFLIATPQMPDPRFAQKVVYICVHNRDGAMGLVINGPMSDVHFSEIFRSAGVPMPDGLQPQTVVYQGGPVELANVFFLHSTDYNAGHFLEVAAGVRLTSDPQLLHDLAAGKGPQDLLVFLGYSGWGPGQLEGELGVNGWLTLPGAVEIIFRTPDHLKWRRAAQLYGIDIALFGDISGSA